MLPDNNDKKEDWIHIRGAKTHNLQNVDLDIPKGKLVVFSGVSGSGKSSIAFDTLYQEGQRRYVESLSSNLRKHLQEFKKPDVESLEGLSPTMAIEQKTAGKNPRSTVGTLTEIHDYLRVLWARLSTPHCPQSGQALASHSQEDILLTIQDQFINRKLMILAPVVEGKKGLFENERLIWLAQGYSRALVDGQIIETDAPWQLDSQLSHNISLVVDRLTLTEEDKIRLSEAVFKSLELTQGLCQIYDIQKEQTILFSTHAYSSVSGLSYRALEPEDFSFNSQRGMCETCQGLGWAAVWDLDRIIDSNKSIAEDCCAIATSYQTVRYKNIYDNLARLYGFSVTTPWKKLSSEARKIWLEGFGDQWIRMQFTHPITGKTWSDRVQWHGVLNEAWQRYQGYKTEKSKESLRIFLHEGPCQSCSCSRLKPYPSAAKLCGWTLHSFCHLSIDQAKETLESMSLTPSQLLIARELRSEVLKRLEFLSQVGLGYLQLDRTAPTLSGGEAQRVRLSSQIGSGLVGVTYILDEPSIGLHSQDNTKLIQTLCQLRDSGTNVIVVEHDEETILNADHVVDFGPGAGKEGGRVVYSGDVEGLLKSEESLTGSYLSGRLQVAPSKRRKPGKNKILIKGASHHNLKEMDVSIPMNMLVVVTGVSGSGKSSLITETLVPYLSNKLHNSSHPVGKVDSIDFKGFEKIIGIDQDPIGRLPRSNPATYIKVFDDIRDLFSELPSSKARGYLPGRFSFNVKEGSCEHCSGMGYVKLEMDFLEAEYVECPDCKGQQFDEATLDITFKGKNIRQILDMSVDEATSHFSEIPSISRKLRFLQDVGLGYLPLGHPSPYLSGGEAQRIKLAKELSRPSNEPTLYILDEPTTGLHLRDVDRLLQVLHRLVDKGHSVLMIEHHLEVIKQADWLIEIGPTGGNKGGYLIASGSPETLAKIDCPTGRMLGKELKISGAVTPSKKQEQTIRLKGARQHNLKGVDVTIPHHQMVAFCGPSGSGKSSLLIDTLYAAGQRKYVDSLSAYARQFVRPLPEPRLERVEGLSPSVAIENKETTGNIRSTVGTLTEIYDYLRLLFTRLGTAYCPESGERIESVDASWVCDQVNSWEAGTKLQLLAPLHVSKNQSLIEKIERLKAGGLSRFFWKDAIVEADELIIHLQSAIGRSHSIEILIDRFKSGQSDRQRQIASIEQAKKIGEGQIIIRPLEGDPVEINMGYCVPSTGKSYPGITPQLFAFNTKEGQCPTCKGTGIIKLPDLISSMKSKDQKIDEWALEIMGEKLYKEVSLLKGFDFFRKKTIKALLHKGMTDFLKGNSSWIGLEFWLDENIIKWAASNSLLSLLNITDCSCYSCNGSRLNALARNVKVHDTSLGDLVLWPVQEVEKWIEKVDSLTKKETNTKVLHEILDQLKARLKFLLQVGLEYLTLNRSAPTLSGGETQRIRLAAQLGSGLCGVLYILDEPTSGLHTKDIDRLLVALEGLKKLGNTLAMVEHQPSILKACDRLYEMGPGAGQKGGWLVRESSAKGLIEDANSPTGEFLRHPLDFKKKPRVASSFLQVKEAKAFELKNIDVDIPLGIFACLTGVSGSGKSTLVEKILHRLWQKREKRANVTSHPDGTVIGWDAITNLDYIDSTPLGLTSRSDVGTYTEILTKIRDLYAQMPEAKIKGLKPGNFSFNTKQGMCKSCQGMGYKKIDLKFLPPVKTECKNCCGQRLNPISLEIKFKGYNFGQILHKNAAQLIEIFGNIPSIKKRLQTLIDVGLDYLPLGFEVAHLSIGESQRLKLVPRLYRVQPGTFLIIDEPCKGLHPRDVDQVHATLDKIVDKGISILCIEHQIRFISKSDWIIEMGPEAGEKGGQIMAMGSPKDLSKINCPTGLVLSRYDRDEKTPSKRKKS